MVDRESTYVGGKRMSQARNTAQLCKRIFPAILIRQKGATWASLFMVHCHILQSPTKWQMNLLHSNNEHARQLFYLSLLCIFLFLATMSAANLHMAFSTSREHREIMHGIMDECSQYATCNPINEVG